MTYALPPDLVLVLGFRTILSLIGIITILCAFWMMERRWDEQGSAAYEKAKENSTGSEYKAVEGNTGKSGTDDLEAPYMPAPKEVVYNDDGSRDIVRVATEDADEKATPDVVDEQTTPDVVVPLEDLKEALPLPKGLLVGFGIWAFSFLFHPDGGFNLYSSWNICCFLLVVAAGALIAYPIRNSTLKRDLDLKKKAVSGLIVVSIFIIVSAMLDKETEAPWYFCSFGALLLLFSYHIIRRSRKMGVSWEIEGKPSYDICVQSLGALTLLFGFFLLWVGTNALLMADFVSAYIPIYLNYRAWLVFVAGLIIIVPSLLALDLAFDEGSEPVEYWLNGQVFGEASRKFTMVTLEPFAKALETPFFFMTGWFLLGLCSFMPFGGGFSVQKVFACLLPIAIGPVYGLKVLPAYWNADAVEYRKWTYVYYALMVCFFTSIGAHGEAPLIMSMLGAIFIVIGQHVDMIERKRGNWWLQERSVNPDPISAFGFGHPTYLVGWIMLCLGMSIPM